MPILQVLVILLVIGVLVWAVETVLGPYIADPWKKMIRGVALVGTVIWLLFIGLHYLGLDVPLPPFKR